MRTATRKTTRAATTTRPRVLLLAEAANPEWVSVPLVGWSLARALADCADVHVVTQVRNRDAFARTGLVEGRDFTAIDSEAVARRLHALGKLLARGGRGLTTITALEAFAYYAFERLVWQRFGPQIEAGGFDVVHRITPLSPVIPSPIARRCARAGVPFVLGPLNGGVPWPREMRGLMRREREWLSAVRGLHRCLPAWRSTRSSAAAILVASRAALDEMPARWRDKCRYLPENAVDPGRFPPRAARTPGRPLRVVFLGRLVPYKGADMLIEAAAPLIRAGDLQVDILGDGPERDALALQAQRENLGEGLHFHGWIEHARVAEILSRADVLGFPSVREFGGGVVLEAMALGVVPVVVDYGGPGELVTPRTGFALPLGSRERIVATLRETLARIAAAPEVLVAMSRACQARVQTHFTWSAKAESIVRLYRWLLDRSLPEPLYPLPIPDGPEYERPS